MKEISKGTDFRLQRLLAKPVESEVESVQSWNTGRYLFVYSSSRTCHSATLSSILRAVALRTVNRFRKISYLENNNIYFKRFFEESTSYQKNRYQTPLMTKFINATTPTHIRRNYSISCRRWEIISHCMRTFQICLKNFLSFCDLDSIGQHFILVLLFLNLIGFNQVETVLLLL